MDSGPQGAQVSLDIEIVPFDSPRGRELVYVRNEVLRRPLGLVMTPEDLASEAAEIHIAAVRENRVIGGVLLRPEGAAVRLRQMAVLPENQGQGIGRTLVTHAEEIARDRGFREVNLHARLTAVPFYTRLGYRVISGEYLEVSIPHVTMMKELL